MDTYLEKKIVHYRKKFEKQAEELKESAEDQGKGGLRASRSLEKNRGKTKWVKE